MVTFEPLVSSVSMDTGALVSYFYTVICVVCTAAFHQEVGDGYRDADQPQAKIYEPVKCG